MTRLIRLRAVRAVQLIRGLRDLAETERRAAQLGAMDQRLRALAAELPPADAISTRQADAAARLRLSEAGANVAAAVEAVARQRSDRATTALRLRVRLDVVDAAIGRS